MFPRCDLAAIETDHLKVVAVNFEKFLGRRAGEPVQPVDVLGDDPSEFALRF